MKRATELRSGKRLLFTSKCMLLGRTSWMFSRIILLKKLTCAFIPSKLLTTRSGLLAVDEQHLEIVTR